MIEEKDKDKKDPSEGVEKKEEIGRGTPFRGILISAEKNGTFKVQTPGIDSVFELYGILVRVLNTVKKDLGEKGD